MLLSKLLIEAECNKLYIRMVRWMSNEYFFYNCPLLLETNFSVLRFYGWALNSLVARILLASLSSAWMHESLRCGPKMWRMSSTCGCGTWQLCCVYMDRNDLVLEGEKRRQSTVQCIGKLTGCRFAWLLPFGNACSGVDALV